MVAYDAGVEESAFRTNLVITVDAVETDDPEVYTDHALAAHERERHAFQLLDRVEDMLGGKRATRTLAHHDAAGWAVTLEQWRVLHERRAYTVTASAATLDYDAVADALAAAAESFRP